MLRRVCATDSPAGGYAIKLAGAAIVILFLGLIAVLIFDKIWFKIGFGAAFAVVACVILVFAWFTDRKAKKTRAGIDELPHI